MQAVEDHLASTLFPNSNSACANFFVFVASQQYLSGLKNKALDILNFALSIYDEAIKNSTYIPDYNYVNCICMLGIVNWDLKNHAKALELLERSL